MKKMKWESSAAVIQVLVAAVGDSSLAVQEAAAAALRNNAQQYVTYPNI
jgi:hypothetical protein